MEKNGSTAKSYAKRSETDLKSSKDAKMALGSDDGAAMTVWPSERVAPGGLFHHHKVEYSKETADLLQLLMKESRMSMMMRGQINERLRNGEPLPEPKPVRFNLTNDPDRDTLEILRRARNAKRKSLQQIMSSGAYEMTRYRPRPDGRVPSEKAKKQLQEAMSGIRLSETTLKAKRRCRPESPKTTTQNMIDELLNQIQERAEWLAEMEELGMGKKYRDEIREQVAERLRHIKALETKIKLQKEGYYYVE